MAELVTLRKSLVDTRKELAHALYQYDAATRVISRLVKEKEATDRELEVAKSDLAALKTQLERNQGVTEEPVGHEGISRDICDRI